MANPMYGQNKFDSTLAQTPKLHVGPEFGFGDDNAEVENGQVINSSAITIPAGTLVHKVYMLCTVVGAGGTAGTTEFDVGDVGDPNFYLDNVDHETGFLGTVNNVITDGNTATNQPAKYYSAADTIAAKCIAKSATSGKARLLVWMSDLNDV